MKSSRKRAHAPTEHTCVEIYAVTLSRATLLVGTHTQTHKRTDRHTHKYANFDTHTLAHQCTHNFRQSRIQTITWRKVTMNDTQTDAQTNTRRKPARETSGAKRENWLASVRC